MGLLDGVVAFKQAFDAVFKQADEADRYATNIGKNRSGEVRGERPDPTAQRCGTSRATAAATKCDSAAREASEAKLYAQRDAEREAEAVARREADAQRERLEARRVRQQELLRRPPDPTRRVFQAMLHSIEVTNMGEDELGPFDLRLTLGGDFRKVEEPGVGLVTRGRRGKQLRTSPCVRLRMIRTCEQHALHSKLWTASFESKTNEPGRCRSRVCRGRAILSHAA